MEIWGASILAIRGHVSCAATASAVSPGMFYWASMVIRNEADLAAGHPNPSYASANPDKYSDWYGLGKFATPYAVSASVTGGVFQTPMRRDFAWRNPRKGRIAQPEDQLVMTYGYDQGTAASTITFQCAYDIWVALP